MSVKQRQSNFELLRLICMMMVIIGHVNYGKEGWPTQALINEMPWLYLWRVLVNQFTIISVPVFVMISGWFGIRPSFRGFCNLMFQVFFSVALCAVLALSFGEGIDLKQALLSMLGAGHWFIPSYVILFVLSPVLNAFVERVEEKQFRFFLVIFFLAEFFYGYITEVGYFYRGYSALHFIGLYLLARYLHLYPNRFTRMSSASDFWVYGSISLVTALLFYFGTGWIDLGFHLVWIISPFVVLASAYFLLAFSKFSFKSRTINWMASSAFAIYLFQENSFVRPYFKSAANALFYDGGFVAGVFQVFLFLCVFAVSCILVDKIRLVMWKKIERHFFITDSRA